MPTFRNLHVPGEPLVMPNPWDVGSAKILASMGFRALATSSAGFAHSIGRPDAVRAVTREETIDHAADLTNSTGLPVNADLERCFADDPERVAETITLTAARGVAGGSIEDATGIDAHPLYGFDDAVARVAAAVAAARAAPGDFVLTARAEGFLWGDPDLSEIIRRLRAFEQAGADVLYAPGLPDLDAVQAVVDAVDLPVNVLPGPGMTVRQLADIGVARISTGSGLSRVAYGALMNAASELRDSGTFDHASSAVPFATLNRIFAG